MSTLYVDNLQPNLGSRVMAAGHVVQVVSQEFTNQTSTTSTSMVSTGIALSIAPSSTSSKILISVKGLMGTGTGYFSYFTLDRDGTNIGSSTGQTGSYTGYLNYMARPVSVDNSGATNFSFETLDSPSSTSTLTYTLQYCVNSGGTVTVGRRNSDTQVKSPTTITLMEIAQ